MPPTPDTPRRRGRVARRIGLVILLFVCVLLGPALVGWSRAAVECRMFGGGPPAESPPAQTATAPPNYHRPEEQTYLTLPEWYIVYSADEYAAYIAHNHPSGFPYFQAVGQFWQAYDDVCAVTRDRYPFNSDYHLTLAVIGASFTAENVFKGLYENTIGRASEWTSSGDPTAEEIYGRQVAAEYGTFLHTIPWYEFPFEERLVGLWNLPQSGPNVIRKIERRGALSLEYGVKAVYGWLIRVATGSVYAPEDLEILARAEGVTPEVLAREPQVRVVEATGTRSALVSLPRYEAFTLLLPRLLARDVRFSEIAGNHEIMMTVLAPDAWRYSGHDGETLFALPILTQPDRARVALKVPVGALQTVIGELERASASESVTIEHIYDY